MTFSITAYIRQQLKKGYSPGTIRKTLLNSGYSPYEVDNALTHASSRRVVVPARVIGIIVIILIILIIAVVISLKLLAPVPKTLDLHLKSLKTQFQAGDEINFIKEVVSNTDEQANVQFVILIKESKTREVLVSITENIVIGKNSVTETRMWLPSDASLGDYSIEATLVYKGIRKMDSFKFKIIPELEQGIPMPVEEKVQCPESCDDYNVCTRDYCEKGICKHDAIAPCCGNRICEPGESALNCKSDCAVPTKDAGAVMESAKKKAKNDAQGAAVLCNSIPDAVDADKCFADIAEISGDSILCESIQDSERRDECFITFALNNDFSVCDKISSPYYLRSCYTLEKSKELEMMVAKYG